MGIKHFDENDSGESYFYTKALVDYHLKKNNIMIMDRHQINIKDNKYDLVEWNHNIDQPSIDKLIELYSDTSDFKTYLSNLPYKFKFNSISNKDNTCIDNSKTYFLGTTLSNSGNYKFKVKNLTVSDINNIKIMFQPWNGQIIINLITIKDSELYCSFNCNIPATIITNTSICQVDIIIFAKNCNAIRDVSLVYVYN